MAYFLAQATGRPIKFIPRHANDLESFSHRHPAVVTIRSGVKRDGTILAREVRVRQDAANFHPGPRGS